MDYYFGSAEGNLVILSQEEFNHLRNAKRIRPGDNVLVTDGNGTLFTAECDGTSSLAIIKKDTFERNPFRLHVAVAPTKNIDRIEWFIEKAVETGIEEISFLLCRHSERKEVKTDRLNRVAIAAL